MEEIKMESKHLMIIGIIGLFFLQNIILLEPQSHTNNNMDKIIFNNVSPSQLYYSYNISIHNSPSGNGYYQQLITLKNYSIYNINSNGSNFYVAYENNTLIYSWIQNINKTVITLWSKILNGTSEIKIDVYNNKTNLFSANGHIGEAPQLSATYGAYFNAPLVFGKNNVTDFLNLSETENMLDMSVVTSSYYFSNGIVFPNGITSTNANTNTIASNLHYNENSVYLGTETMFNVSTIKVMRLGFGYASYVANSYYLGGGSVSSLQVVNNTGSTFGYGSISAPNMTYFRVLENDTGNYPYVSALGTTAKSAITIANRPARAFIQLNAGYEKYQYLFVASVGSNGMPTFTISSQIMFTYHIQIKSFNNQNTIKNCFKYNNNVYNSITNTFIFSNSSKFIFRILPQNYTIFNTSYLTNTSIISIKQNQYTSANFINYYYNISISYYSKTSTPINYYSPPNYYFTIGIIIFLLIGGLIIYTKIRSD